MFWLSIYIKFVVVRAGFLAHCIALCSCYLFNFTVMRVPLIIIYCLITSRLITLFFTKRHRSVREFVSTGQR